MFRLSPDGAPGPIVARSLGPPPAPVTVGLQGGLGNQLFQWAFAAELRAQGVPVRIDPVRCRGARPVALWPLVRQFPLTPRPLALLRWVARGVVPGRLPLVEQHGMTYDPAIVARARAGGAYLLGYFQSPRYFSTVAHEVRASSLEVLSAGLTESGREAERRARVTDSVAVHVRRGDYVSNPTAAAHHGVLPEDYYRAALAAVPCTRGQQVTWFSDDLAWVRDNLAGPGDAFCTPDLATTDGGEIALMAAHRTRVVANSSFSWWAGWLGRQPGDEGRVVAPHRWLADGTSATDLIPDTWETV